MNEVVIAARIQISSLPQLNLQAFSSLTLNSWISIICLTFITSVIIYLAERLIPLPSDKSTAGNILTYAVGLLFQRDIGGLNPRNFGSRVVSTALAIALMIVMTTYTAVLTARNIVNIKTLPISGIIDHLSVFGPEMTQCDWRW